MQPTLDDHIRTLMLAHGEELKAFAKTRWAKSDEVEDLLQDVWSSYAGAAVRDPIEQPRAWLFRALRNRITDLYRRQEIRPLLVAAPPSEVRDHADNYPDQGGFDYSLNGEYDETEFWEDVYEALAILPTQQAIIFRRNVIEGETLTTIAADLGIPIGTAISRKRYALARLRELLADTHERFFEED